MVAARRWKTLRTLLGVFALWLCASLAWAEAAPSISPQCFGLATMPSFEDFSDEVGVWNNHLEHSSLQCSLEDGDLSSFESISFRMYSARANQAGFVMIIRSENPETDGPDYYSARFTVDWEGWKEFDIPLASLNTSRRPVGWEQIESIEFWSRGWDNEPKADTELYLGPITFRMTEEVALLSPASPGFVTQELDVRHVRSEHPRLLATADDFARIKAGVASDPTMRMWHTLIKMKADELLSQSVSRYEIPDGRRLLATSRQVLERIYILGMTYRVEGDLRYAQRAWEELKAAAEFPDWNPSHFLDTAEMSHAFAIGYDWLYDVWTSDQRTFLRTALVEKGLRPAAQAYRAGAWWTEAAHNWNFVSNSGIALGALAIADEEPELAEGLLRSAIASVSGAMQGYAPDGGWNEGIGYWDYGTRYLVRLIAGLESAFGTDFGLSNAPGFSNTGDFHMSMLGATGSFNFGDTGFGTPQSPILFWLAKKFDKPEYTWWRLQTSRNRGEVADLLWYDPSLLTDFDPDALDLDHYVRGVETVSFRSDWSDPAAVYVGFKGGDNTVGHGNLDLGTFVLDALGVRWAVDLGADDYNLPGYFGNQRWTYYRNRSEGQNTLVINPTAGPEQDPSAQAQIVYFHSRPSEGVAIADLTPGYRQHASRVMRGVALFDQRRQMLIHDEVELHQPGDLWWFMHTRARVNVQEGGRSALLEQDGKRLLARILSPADARFTVMRASPMDRSPNPSGQQSNSGVQKLSVHLSHITNLTLVVQLVPLESEADFAPVPPRVIPLDEWGLSDDGGATLWPPLPRVRMDVLSPTRNAEVHGVVPVQLAVDSGGLTVESVSVSLGERAVYEGESFPPEFTIDTGDVEDGTYTLELTARFAGGESISRSLPLRIANAWQIEDELQLPLVLDFLGTIDRSQTSDESSGWGYRTEDAEAFFGDGDRKVRLAQTTEHLRWESPNLQRFRVRLYVREGLVDELRRLVSLTVSPDGKEWTDTPFEVMLGERSDAGWREVDLVGAPEEAYETHWFQLTLVADPGAGPDELQIGRVVLRGLKGGE